MPTPDAFTVHNAAACAAGSPRRPYHVAPTPTAPHPLSKLLKWLVARDRLGPGGHGAPASSDGGRTGGGCCAGTVDHESGRVASATSPSPRWSGRCRRRRRPRRCSRR